jgi:energy-coupling factor transporter ATP-binding protein EcfA2
MLELDELHRRFGDVVALDGMTFTVEAGKVVGFLGPNGAGKTTAMRAVLGVTALDSGTIRFDGREVDAQAPCRSCSPMRSRSESSSAARATASSRRSPTSPPPHRSPPRRCTRSAPSGSARWRCRLSSACSPRWQRLAWRPASTSARSCASAPGSACARRCAPRPDPRGPASRSRYSVFSSRATTACISSRSRSRSAARALIPVPSARARLIARSRRPSSSTRRVCSRRSALGSGTRPA